MSTTFGRWLDESGIPAYRFAQQLGVARPVVQRLAGVQANRVERPRLDSGDVALMVAEITGIPVETILREARESERTPALTAAEAMRRAREAQPRFQKREENGK